MVVVLERQQVVVGQPAGVGPFGGRFVELPGPPVWRGDIIVREKPLHVLMTRDIPERHGVHVADRLLAP